MNSNPRPIRFRPIPGGTSTAAVVNLIEALTDLYALTLPDADPRGAYQGPLALDSDFRTVLVPVPGPGLEEAQAQMDEVLARVDGPIPDSVDVIMTTSGSTKGKGSVVGLSAEALRASAKATDSALGGPGRWVLALPIDRIAGFQVVSRSVLAETRPTIVDTTRGFRPRSLARAIERAGRGGERVYVSIVPTQLNDILADEPETIASLAKCAAVLVGGAASTPNLLERAAAAGLNIVTTYGMTETCGGCVYNGLPLPGTEVVTVSDRIMITSPVLMEGYLDDRSGKEFVTDGVRRWLRTNDCGHMQGPRVVVDGRIDDVINTGGVKVPASKVRQCILEVPGVAEVAVVPVPDERWGSLVTAVVVPTEDIDVRLINPLRELAGLPPLGEEPEPSEPVWPAAAAEAAPSPIQMTPVEAAMAAMAAKIRGADVDVVEAARTGLFTPPPEPEPETQPEAETETAVEEPKPTLEPLEPGDNLAVRIRNHVADELDRASAPRAVVLLEWMPMLSPGKIDRVGVQAAAEFEVKSGRAWVR